MDILKIFEGAVENRETVSNCLDCFNSEDIRNGYLIINEKIMNKALKPIILKKLEAYLDDYSIIFSGGFIYLNLNLSIKKFKNIKAMYRINIQEFLFNEKAHKLVFQYEEDLKFESKIIQIMFEKALGFKGGSVLQMVAGLLKKPYITVTSESAYIDLDEIGVIRKTDLGKYRLEYLECDNERLRFKIFSPLK